MSLQPRADEVRYQFYGLTLSSDTPLLDLPRARHAEAQSPDIRITFADCHAGRSSALHWFMSWSSPSGEPWLSCARADSGYVLRFPGLADFWVDRAGRHIVVMADPGIAPETIQHLLLDQALPLLLNLQGREALHATAVLTPRGVCVFAGPSGAGKSTLAASFLFAGYPVLSDDCLVLDESGGRIVAYAAHPGLRLCEDAVAALKTSPARLRQVAHYTSKRSLVPDQAQQEVLQGPCPVARIYSLVRTNRAQGSRNGTNRLVTPLSFRDGVMELITMAFRLDITDRRMLRRQLLFWERVVSQVPVRRLRIPDSFSSLPAVRAAILGDLSLR